MKAQDLNGTHLGFEVQVEAANVSVKGILMRVEHAADKVSDVPLGSSPFFYPAVLGRQWVELEFTGGTLQVEPTAKVKVRTQ